MVVNGRIYIGVANGMADIPCTVGRIVALSAADGTVLWDTPLTTPDHLGAGVWSTPAIDVPNNRLYVATGNSCDPPVTPLPGVDENSILSVDLTSGTVGWVYHHQSNDSMDLDFGSSLVMFNGKAGAISKSGLFVAVNQAVGTLAWQTRIAQANSWPYGGGGVNSPSFADGRVYVGGGPVANPPDQPATTYDGSFTALDPADGHVIWRKALNTTPLGASAVTNGLVFTGDKNDLVALDGATGTVLTRLPAGAYLWGGIAIAGGDILVGDNAGVLHCYSIDGF
jgi:outer membrane protein assembly factor BamB